MNKKQNKIKRILVILCTLVLVLLIALGLVSNYLVDFALKRTDEFTTNLDPGKTDEVDEGQKIIDENEVAFDAYVKDWKSTINMETETIESSDSLKLVGHYYTQAAETHNWAILIHGYRNKSSAMEKIASVYSNEFHFNVLLPDLRACGESEGDYIGMGYLDKDDIKLWIDEIIKKDPQANIVVSGVSMGGATTLMLSGEELPDNVKVLIEDCGYTSVWDIFAHELDFLYHLPTFPVLNSASLLSELKAGYSFKEASCVDAVSKSTLPMLFIHGENDEFVQFNNLDILYNAKKNGDKEKLVIKDAGHGVSYLRDPQTYFSTVKAFLYKQGFEF